MIALSYQCFVKTVSPGGNPFPLRQEPAPSHTMHGNWVQFAISLPAGVPERRNRTPSDPTSQQPTQPGKAVAGGTIGRSEPPGPHSPAFFDVENRDAVVVGHLQETATELPTTLNLAIGGLVGIGLASATDGIPRSPQATIRSDDPARLLGSLGHRGTLSTIVLQQPLPVRHRQGSIRRDCPPRHGRRTRPFREPGSHVFRCRPGAQLR